MNAVSKSRAACGVCGRHAATSAARSDADNSSTCLQATPSSWLDRAAQHTAAFADGGWTGFWASLMAATLVSSWLRRASSALWVSSAATRADSSSMVRRSSSRCCRCFSRYLSCARLRDKGKVWRQIHHERCQPVASSTTECRSTAGTQTNSDVMPMEQTEVDTRTLCVGRITMSPARRSASSKC